MYYTSRDILVDNIYDEIDVVLITGQYDSIINMVIDTIKDKCSVTLSNNEQTSVLENEFNIEVSDNKLTNIVDFDTFVNVVDTPPVNGKWLCICDLDSLAKKKYDILTKYINKPNKYGILVIKSTDFRTYAKLAKKKKFELSRNVSHIDLSFPDSNTMTKIIKQMFEEKGKKIESNAMQHLLIKLNGNYKDIVEIVDMVASEVKDDTIKLYELRKSINGIEYFSVNDFIEELTKPLRNDKTNNKKVYRIMADMIDTYGPSMLVGILIKNIDTYIDLRVLINKGIIPVKINYFYNDVIKEIEKTEKYSKYGKMKEFTLRRKASVAAQTSLRDWIFMRMILERVKYNRSDEACIRAIYDVTIRSVLNLDRLYNVIGIDNIIDKEETQLNKFKYYDSDELEDVRLKKKEKELIETNRNNIEKSHMLKKEMQQGVK